MTGAPVAEVLSRRVLAWEVGVQMHELRQGPRGPGPGHRWKTEGCSDGGALHSKSDGNWNGGGCLWRRSWVTQAFPSWGCVTLGKSFPVPQPWLSPVGWHKGAARFNVADAPHMLSLVPGTWGHPDDTLLDCVVFNASVGALGLYRPYPAL